MNMLILLYFFLLNRSPPSRARSRRKTTRAECASCSDYALPDKRLCVKCLRDASGVDSPQMSDMMDWINKSVSSMMSQVTDNGGQPLLEAGAVQGYPPQQGVV
ncbi:hypothetical protein XELAEV_18035173mg [Xenopus laevis]|uniref:Uncharacterized protein n=1 Tax=Xenopus laevis TaxID=8355 RepID=A0A974CF92_XENLA|nr:hypothetical protein XELAEV_18035173mg [Xenopus laevis]